MHAGLVSSLASYSAPDLPPASSHPFHLGPSFNLDMLSAQEFVTAGFLGSHGVYLAAVASNSYGTTVLVAAVRPRYDTPLETILKNLNRDTVFICGTLTNFCCGSTARQAFERGFKVLFVSDLNSTDDEHMHEMELNVLRKGFARVLSSAELMEMLNRQE